MVSTEPSDNIRPTAPQRTKQGTRPVYLVPAMVGVARWGPDNDWFQYKEILLTTVGWVGGFLRDADNSCAFCHSETDSWSDPETDVGKFFAAFPFEETCPICQGRPT